MNDTTTTPATATATKKPDVLPVLEQLAGFYPHLFGAVFRPLKRGIFQDLMQAHPDVFEKSLLKAALATHTRSTRYLAALATGQARVDLHGAAAEATAPEHIHQALYEVFRRRQTRSKEDLRPQLLSRIANAFETSGLSAEDYLSKTLNRDEAHNTTLQEALALAAERQAKKEALKRTYKVSGKSVEAFADMYGLDLQAVREMLE